MNDSTTQEKTAEISPENAHASRLRRLMSQPLSGVLAALAIICLVSSLLSSAFLDAYNLSIIARALAFVGLITLAQTMLMVLGELDLSLGMISGLAAVIGGIAMVHWGMHPALAIPLTLLAGAACGLINGLLVTGLGLHSLALTIGICFGIYSSVFVAAAIAMWLGVKREDLVKSRKEHDPDDPNAGAVV